MITTIRSLVLLPGKTFEYLGVATEIVGALKRATGVMFAGKVIADSTSTLRVEETGHGPVYYIPAKDMALDLMTKTHQNSET